MTRCSMSRWLQRVVRVGAVLWLASMLASCAQASSPSPAAIPPGTACPATDQDQYVYDPERLQVVQACIHVTGRVDVLETGGTDGDTILLLHLDPPYQDLLTPGNREGEEPGDLDIEAVCTRPPVEAIVMALCASDPDPYAGSYPPIGAHVWMEGRYILDLHHASHAELHPLYRIGMLTT